ncbi:copper chaperone PCu(A)C [Pararhodospirillum photometricum]|uniref:Copper chaperone PCu(A)C n=1 Tax=Pararhodospirillum photometricum DSM 122 TaxID=1150469 RepID=H6SNA0_PARPM|nr:copper chaperone PCu(A)C [Pararhodospirillum photometricum]CCG06976.1 Putative uncharacterized protein [Pararhodospirillum photometricum DSM 122]
MFVRAIVLAAGLAVVPLWGAGAQEPSPITVEGAWARASASVARVAGAFMTFHNQGPADRLIKAEADISQRVELHTQSFKNGMATMRSLPGLDIAAKADTVLEPGGLHIMFIDLKAPLKEGDRFPLALTFERAGTIQVEVAVKAAGSMSGMDGMGGMGGMGAQGEKP